MAQTQVTTRRRGAALEEVLLDAAWSELQSVGYRNLTIEAVADRAGTSRAVLYRRWRNRHELVIAAMRRHAPMLSGEAPDTGSLRGDVLGLLQRTADRMEEIGPETIRGLLGDYLSDPDFERTQGMVLQIGAEAMTSILERAEARGEARSNVSSRVAQVPTDLFRNEIFKSRSAPTGDVLVEIVDQVFLPLVSRV